MADKKISQLPASTTPLAGTEELAVVQSGDTKKVSVDNLTTGKNVPALAYNGVTLNRGLANETNSIAFGDALSLANTTSGVSNIAIGSRSLRFCTSGGYNVAVGDSAFPGVGSITGSFNTAVGSFCASKISSGGNNVGFGYATIANVTTASGNAALGSLALNLTTGANNTGVGYKAGDTATTGSNNGFFGYNAQPSAVDVSNEYTYGDANVTKHRFPGGNIAVASGAGIDFSADSSAAGMTSELLDDYEEGTWTGALASAGGSITTATTNTGKYTKIGRQVTASMWIDVDSVLVPSGELFLTGLPFTNGGALTNRTAVTVWANNLAVGAITSITAFMFNNQSQINLARFNAGVYVNDLASYVQATTRFYVSATYFIN